MTTYKCKCGRLVSKSTNADTTGNRDTAECEGCPYLLPWGAFQYVSEKGYVQDIQGHECRMSKDLEYATRFAGSITDKCSCYIASLDFDFLARVSDWIRETYPGDELHGRFSVPDIRPVEYCSNGRYRMSITCAQNKKGVAAKAALLHQFFDDSGARLDMTPEEEKAHVLAAIEAGKEKGQEKGEKKKRMTYKDPWNGWLYRVSPAPDEDDLYHIEYRDPTSSVMFKLWPPMASAGCTMPESLEEVLAARAKKNGWVDADAPEPVEEPDAEEGPAELPKTPAPAPGGELPGDAGAMPAPASTPDLPETAPAGFDYSGLDPETAEHLQNLARRAVTAKQRYILDMMEIVSEAHRELCGAVVAPCDNGVVPRWDNGVVPRWDNSKHGNRGDEAFRRWCESIGVSKSSAYRLLQVQALMDGSTPEEQEVLADAPAKLLYSAAKPSAPEELVQAVKDGDITTNKQYQEALAEIKARDAKINELIEYSEASDRRAEEAEQRAREVEASAQSEHEGASALLADEQRRRQAAEQARIAAEGQAASAASSARAAEAQAKEATARIAALEKEREQHVQWLMDYQDQVDGLRDELCSRKPQQVEAQVVDQDELQRMAELAAVARVIESARESVEAILKRALASVDEVNEDIYHAIQDLTVTLSDCYEAAYDVIEPPAEDAQDGEEAVQDDA